MRASSFHGRKIFNDPVYGFIPIENELVFDIIEHPYFQRLRRIKQLGLTHLVYPGALHTRFHHSIGAMHLMNQVISALRLKRHDITDEEAIGASLAILLHDIGHGPFSHALEHTILEDVNHEDISKVYMQRLNEEFNGKLHRAIDIFNNTYKRKFLHQLVSSQLDMDRMDYLMRDSFYSGVLEGVINTDRIIKMMTVSDDKLAVEVKGIYSIEKYIIARRLMYWQVYLHKTVIAAESMLMHILKRAKYLVRKDEMIFTTPALLNFLKYSFQIEDLKNDQKLLDLFSELDDFDIFASIKVWAKQSDYVLSMLCSNLINRHLFRIELQNTPFDKKYIEKIKSETQKIFKLSEDEAEYLIITDSTANYAYHPMSDKINIILNSGEMVDIAKASDQLNISVLFKPVTKYFVCYPKIIQIVNN